MGISRSYYADLECGRRRITDELEMLATTHAAIIIARKGLPRQPWQLTPRWVKPDNWDEMTRMPP
jgi:hypothetical protein